MTIDNDDLAAMEHDEALTANFRAFVEGAKWWEFTSTGGTMWPSDQAKAWAEAEKKWPYVESGKLREAQLTIDSLISVLKLIAMLGGNLPDSSLTDRTGPNDAVSRGLMYTSARKYAADMLTKAGYRLNEFGTEWVKDE